MIYRTILAALAVCGAVSARLFTENSESQKYMWEQFKAEHSKAYVTMEEEITRFGHFLANLQLADERNAEEAAVNGTATHGITRFADMSQEEFKQMFLASIIPTHKDAEVATVAAPPLGTGSSKDWAGVLTTPVKNQGQCGSCWAFSATEQIESDTMRMTGKSYILSAQQVTSCTPRPAMGCNGGFTEAAYDYVTKAGGIEQNSDYPYKSMTGNTGSCTSTASKYVTTVSKYYTVNGETAMSNYVLATGPLSVCVDAMTWNTYTGGIMSKCGTNIDHCVQAVGVDTSTGGYWKVRNSWGSSWGESGYIRLAYGKNTCGITNDPTYTSVKLV